jgi:hypothetical protein
VGNASKSAAAASGGANGDLAGASRSRAPGHESRRDLPLDLELDAANPTEVPNGTGRRRR